MFASGERITKPSGLAKDQMSFPGTCLGHGASRQFDRIRVEF